jgi:glycylpeptide N-tetradecanoyltransferase
MFIATVNATTDGGMDLDLIEKMKARNTVDMGDGAFISTWKAGGNKIIREEMVAFGGEPILHIRYESRRPFQPSNYDPQAIIEL